MTSVRTLQAEKRKRSALSQASALKALRATLHINQEAMGKLLGVSREWVSRLENGNAEFSEYVSMKMAALPTHPAVSPDHIAEASAKYGAVPREDSVVEHSSNPRKDKMLNPHHSPKPAEPSREKCLVYFTAYLAAAEQVEGGIGHAWYLLQRHFPLSEIERMGSETKITASE